MTVYEALGLLALPKHPEFVKFNYRQLSLTFSDYTNNQYHYTASASLSYPQDYYIVEQFWKTADGKEFGPFYVSNVSYDAENSQLHLYFPDTGHKLLADILWVKARQLFEQQNVFYLVSLQDTLDTTTNKLNLDVFRTFVGTPKKEEALTYLMDAYQQAYHAEIQLMQKYYAFKKIAFTHFEKTDTGYRFLTAPDYINPDANNIIYEYINDRWFPYVPFSPIVWYHDVPQHIIITDDNRICVQLPEVYHIDVPFRKLWVDSAFNLMFMDSNCDYYICVVE